MQLPDHKTKIVCTIGPASRSKGMLKKLMKSGMNVARLNFSHGNLDEHRENIQNIRSLSAQLNLDVAILIDLPGPKIRIGTLQHEPLLLKKGDNLTLTTRDVAGTASQISVNYEKLPQSVQKGGIIYLNDGFIQLKVRDVSGDNVHCKVIIGGSLLSHKGLNLPQAKLFLDAVTKKDLEFVDFGLSQGVDTFSISFVEKAADILKVKQFAEERGRSIYTVAKIERAEAVQNMDEILNVTDAIMVARGDLGVQIPIEHLPMVQKKLIRKANLLGRPVITATQMLESMTENIRPTRAEVTDVANAILDGTDAVMLSEESAIGKYPADAVKMMAKIAATVERQRNTAAPSSGIESFFKSSLRRKNTAIEDVISMDAFEAARELEARFILTPTHTGNTPRRISRFKPDCWVLSFTGIKHTHHFLAFSYGVHSFLMTHPIDDWEAAILSIIKELKLAKKDRKVILTEGKSKSGGTDSLRVVTLS